MKFKIASHDTMSYLKPEKWYMRPFHFMGKCQNKDIGFQYRYGVRLFDIRVKWDKKQECWKFAHGSLVFKMTDGKDVDWLFSWIDCQNEKCMVRLILEYNKPVKNMSEIDQKFIDACQRWMSEYKNITWFEFRRKYDWKKLYTYEGEPNVDMYQATSSMTCFLSTKLPWLDDWYPYWYAKIHNKDNILQGTSHEYLLLDFIGLD